MKHCFCLSNKEYIFKELFLHYILQLSCAHVKFCSQAAWILPRVYWRLINCCLFAEHKFIQFNFTEIFIKFIAEQTIDINLSLLWLKCRLLIFLHLLLKHIVKSVILITLKLIVTLFTVLLDNVIQYLCILK